MKDRIKLLFIAGDGRSGTTILARLLGELDNFVNAGEMLQFFLDEKAHAKNVLCGCDHTVAECEFWKDIADSVDPAVRTFATRYVRTRFLPLLASPVKLQAFRDNLQHLSANIQQLIYAVADKSQSGIVVDTSKRPPYSFIIGQMQDPEPYVLHIVKDPRDVVGSWMKAKGYIRRRSLLQAVSGWSSFNIMNEWAVRISKPHYLLMRYEDFVQNPAESLQRIVTWIEGAPRSLPFLSGKIAHLSMQHLLGGNPDKFETGEIEIKPRPSSLAYSQQLITSALTLPLLLRYHYPLLRSPKRARILR